MITGVNQNLTYEGATYHIQIEDVESSSSLEVRVYVEGRVLFQKRYPYEASTEDRGSEKALEASLRDQQEKLLKLLRAAILKGRIKA